MLMVMNSFDTYFKLSFPVLHLNEEENPDRIELDEYELRTLNLLKELRNKETVL